MKTFLRLFFHVELWGTGRVMLYRPPKKIIKGGVDTFLGRRRGPIITPDWRYGTHSAQEKIFQTQFGRLAVIKILYGIKTSKLTKKKCIFGPPCLSEMNGQAAKGSKKRWGNAHSCTPSKNPGAQKACAEPIPQKPPPSPIWGEEK